MGYHNAGFDVVGVDIQRQPHYPFEFHQADALTFPLDGFDAIHASPPCQLYSKKVPNWGRKRTTWTEHPDLLGPTRERLLAADVPYVIENVPGAPIQAQLLLCGTMFRQPGTQPMTKHRLFEGNWPMPMAPATCDHRDVYNPWRGAGRGAAKMRESQGTPWIPMAGGASRKAGITGDLFNAIPPAYTEYIGRALLDHMARLVTAA